MFIGHYGVGFAGKKIEKSPSLGTMFLAAQFMDLLWPIFIVTGIEKVKIVPGLMAANPLDFTYYPFSHSLLFSLIWGFLFGLVYYMIKKNKKASILLGLLVLSHWFLDLIVHRPDLPLYPGGPKVGLGLWNSIPGSIIVELIIFLGGAYIYSKVTRAKNTAGKVIFGSLVAFLLIMYILNFFGSAPPSVEAVGYAGFAQWLIVAWAYWADRKRTIVNGSY